jgi:hypothetical protein
MDNNSPLALRTKIVIFAVFSILLLEIFFTGNDSYRPGFWMKKGINLWTSWIKEFGRLFMNFSFWIYERINFEIIAVSIYNLINPFILLLCSPLYFWYGSFENTSAMQILAMISMYIIILIILIIMENQFYPKYKPTTIFPFLKILVETVYGWAGTFTADVLEVYRILGLEKILESAWKIICQLTLIAYAPIESFLKKFSSIGPAAFTALITIIMLYIHGFLTMGISELPAILLYICITLFSIRCVICFQENSLIMDEVNNNDS